MGITKLLISIGITRQLSNFTYLIALMKANFYIKIKHLIFIIFICQEIIDTEWYTIFVLLIMGIISTIQHFATMQ